MKKFFKPVFSAVMVALATVLSLISLWKLPLGGSVTPASMLPIMLVAYVFGIKWGLVSSFVYAIIQAMLSLSEVMSWGMSSTVVVACILLDYIIAYTVLGLCGCAKKLPIKNNILKFGIGMIFVVLLRFVSHFISGVVLFSEWAVFQPVWLYSIAYNGAFLGLDLAICVVAGLLLYTPAEKELKKLVH